MKRSTDGQDIEDFANEVRKENQLLQSIDIKTKLSEDRIASLEDLNKEYFKNIIELKNRNFDLGLLCVFGFVVILSILMVVLL